MQLLKAEAAGFEPANRFDTVNCFRGSLLQPLGHASEGQIYGKSTDLTSFSAKSINARPSGRDDRAAGSPASPFSRML